MSNLKVAIMFTGFMRTYKATNFIFQKNVFEKNDCDIYCASWKKQENGYEITEADFAIYGNRLKNIVICDNDQFTKDNPPIEYIDRPDDVFKTNPRAKQHGMYHANRQFAQWYIINKCYLGVNEPEKYDILFRVRYDAIINNIAFRQNNKINIPNDIGGCNYSDHMAYGNPQVMQKYCDMVNHIRDLYKINNIDISHAVNMPKFYIEQTEPKIETDINKDISYGLLK